MYLCPGLCNLSPSHGVQPALLALLRHAKEVPDDTDGSECTSTNDIYTY